MTQIIQWSPAMEVNLNIQTLADARTVLALCQHSHGSTKTLTGLNPKQVTRSIASTLEAAEGISGLSEATILLSKSLLYLFMIESGMVARKVECIFGLPYFAHPSIRPNTIMVVGRQNDQVCLTISSIDTMEEFELLIR